MTHGVDQPSILLRVGTVRHRQIPRTEQVPVGNLVASGVDNGRDADRDPSFVTRSARHHTNPFTIFEAVAFGVRRTELHVLLRHEPRCRGAADGFRRVEVLVDDAETQPERETCLLW